MRKPCTEHTGAFEPVTRPYIRRSVASATALHAYRLAGDFIVRRDASRERRHRQPLAPHPARRLIAGTLDLIAFMETLTDDSRTAKAGRVDVQSGRVMS